MLRTLSRIGGKQISSVPGKKGTHMDAMSVGTPSESAPNLDERAPRSLFHSRPPPRGEKKDDKFRVREGRLRDRFSFLRGWSEALASLLRVDGGEDACRTTGWWDGRGAHQPTGAEWEVVTMRRRAPFSFSKRKKDDVTPRASTFFFPLSREWLGRPTKLRIEKLRIEMLTLPTPSLASSRLIISRSPRYPGGLFIEFVKPLRASRILRRLCALRVQKARRQQQHRQRLRGTKAGHQKVRRRIRDSGQHRGQAARDQVALRS